MYIAMNNIELDASADDIGKWEVQMRKGSLSLAVLAALWDGALYGLEILRRLEEVARFRVVEGTIYPLLNRLKSAGFVESEWVESDTGHPRKYFQLTDKGRRYLSGLSRTWRDFESGINALLGPLESRAHAKRRAS